MGDYPSKRPRNTTELTDEVFEPPLNSVSLISVQSSFLYNRLSVLCRLLRL